MVEEPGERMLGGGGESAERDNCKVEADEVDTGWEVELISAVVILVAVGECFCLFSGGSCGMARAF